MSCDYRVSAIAFRLHSGVVPSAHLGVLCRSLRCCSTRVATCLANQVEPSSRETRSESFEPPHFRIFSAETEGLILLQASLEATAAPEVAVFHSSEEKCTVADAEASTRVTIVCPCPFPHSLAGLRTSLKVKPFSGFERTWFDPSIRHCELTSNLPGKGRSLLRWDESKPAHEFTSPSSSRSSGRAFFDCILADPL